LTENKKTLMIMTVVQVQE